jgi:uncharacterized RDD family membrane protein YckC
MECPECGHLVADPLGTEQCERCGAPLKGAAKVEPEAESPLGPELIVAEGFDRVDGAPKQPACGAAARDGVEVEIRWAGLFRRACAAAIDVVVLASLSAILFYLGYVGYAVGLWAHHRALDAGDAGFLVSVLFAAWICLVAGYFVLLHGMEGKTVGKWALGLRVVGAGRRRVSYGQAFVRWLASVPSVFSGLGFWWILLDHEKRAWHDLLARTWVIREGSRPTSPYYSPSEPSGRARPVEGHRVVP